jgi:hypothetical protein
MKSKTKYSEKKYGVMYLGLGEQEVLHESQRLSTSWSKWQKGYSSVVRFIEDGYDYEILVNQHGFIFEDRMFGGA